MVSFNKSMGPLCSLAATVSTCPFSYCWGKLGAEGPSRMHEAAGVWSVLGGGHKQINIVGC